MPSKPLNCSQIWDLFYKGPWEIGYSSFCEREYHKNYPLIKGVLRSGRKYEVCPEIFCHLEDEIKHEGMIRIKTKETFLGYPVSRWVFPTDKQDKVEGRGRGKKRR